MIGIGMTQKMQVIQEVAAMKSDIISNYNKTANTLFKEWKMQAGTVEYKDKEDLQTLHIDHQNNVFIRDGIVCPEQWFSQNVRPLFLLKEAYGGEEDWDLIADHLLSTRPISKMWQRISAWTKGMLATTTENMAPFTKDDPEVNCYGNEYLKQIAVINIKKSRGEKSSDMDVIPAYAHFDKNRLKQQLELCDPTVIICGYTASTLDIILEQPVKKEYNQNLAYHITIKGHDVLVLDYWHPANQYPDIMNYYTLMSIYQQALRNAGCN